MTRKALCLHLLREAGPDRGVRTSEFLQAHCGSRFGARIQELRGEGFVIESERVREGEHVYRLTHDAERGGGAPQQTGIPATASPGAVGAAGESNRDSLSAGGAGTGALFDLPTQRRDAALHDFDESEAA